MRVLSSRCSTGLGRLARRNRARRARKHGLIVYTYDEAAKIATVARRTLERLIAVGEGPTDVELSPRRKGILATDLQLWLERRRRPASSEAPAPLLPSPSLEPIRGRTRPSRIPASSRAPGDEKDALANIVETEIMDTSNLLTGCVKAEELESGFCVTARITAVESREFEEGTKGVLFLDVFNRRGFVLNQTNLKALMAAFGRKSENWVGQDVVVNRTLADFKGKPVPAIRLEVVRRPSVNAPAVAPTPRLVVASAARAGTMTFTTGMASPDAVSAPETTIGSDPPPSAPPPASYDGPADPDDDFSF
jgi:hypothetical protein